MGDLLDKLDKKQKRLLEILTPMQIDARYESYKSDIAQTLNYHKTKDIYNQTKELTEWVQKQLKT